MQDFTVHIPTQIFFGSGKGAEFVETARSFGRQALIVTGQGSAQRLGYLKQTESLLQEQGITTTTFEGIEPNPIAKTIQRCVEENQHKKPDFVLALGGGSVMDSAKAIAALLFSGESDIWPYLSGEAKSGELTGALPILCVPTTAATASEVTPYSVISNPEVNGKSHLAYPFLKPQASWINPLFTLEVPATTTRDGAADILSHVFENYLLGGSDAPLTDKYCESIMKTVMETLPAVLENPKDEKLRGTLLWCSTLALNGYNAAGRVPSLFPLHHMEHALSGYRHELAHGRGLATLFPAYFRWLWEKNRARERMAQLDAALFGGDKSDLEAGLKFIANFERWLQKNSLFQSLESLGFESSQYAEIAAEVLRIHGEDGVMDVLGEFTAADMISIFEATDQAQP